MTEQHKGGEDHPFPILRRLVPVLDRLTAEKDPTDRVLIGVRGELITTANVGRATKWDELVTEMGLPQMSRHGLRRTGATWMADAGFPLYVLQKILGHKSIGTTKGYLHSDLGHFVKAGELANRFLDVQTEAPRRPSMKGRGKSKPNTKGLGPGGRERASGHGLAPCVQPGHLEALAGGDASRRNERYRCRSRATRT